MKEEFSNIHFGAVGRPPIDWRAFDTGLGDANDEAGPVEYDVAEVLGFDPDEDSDSEEVILNDFKNDWREVERAPAGTSEGGQWVGENSVTTEKEALKAMRKYKNGLTMLVVRKLVIAVHQLVKTTIHNLDASKYLYFCEQLSILHLYWLHHYLVSN